MTGRTVHVHNAGRGADWRDVAIDTDQGGRYATMVIAIYHGTGDDPRDRSAVIAPWSKPEEVTAGMARVMAAILRAGLDAEHRGRVADALDDTAAALTGDDPRRPPTGSSSNRTGHSR